MGYRFALRCFFVFTISYSTLVAQQDPAFPKVKADTRLSYKIIEAPGHTYGYDIYKVDKVMIHQASIPGLSGNTGFKVKADAVKVAQLVIGKIKKGEMPPSVSTDELKNLKVTF